jgi:predicted MFS family arabinose efflux permease
VFNGAFLALIVRARDVGGSPGQIGFMLAAYGAGGVLGALAAPTLHRRLAGRTLLVGIAWIWAAIAVALAVPASLVGLAALVLVMNLFGAPYNVVIAARMYELVPDELLGRVRSVVKIVAWGTIPVGTLLGGVLAEGLSARTALLVLGLGMIPIAIVSTLSPGMRSIGDPVSEPDGQPV